MAEGLHAFQQGEIEQAAVCWREAARLYAGTSQAQAHSVVLTHLASAYAALGHYGQEVQSLREALQLAEKALIACRSPRSWAAWGISTALLGTQLKPSACYVTPWYSRRPSTLHNLANLFMTQQKFSDALAMYQDSARLAREAQQSGMATRALAHAALAAERHGQPQVAMTLLDEALALAHQVAPSHDKAYELLLIGRTYQRLAQTEPSLAWRAAAVFTTAADMAQSLHDYRAMSYAWGYLGRLYEEAQRYAEAMQLTRQAVWAGQQTHVPEALYLWHWQSARLLRALGDVHAAIVAYDRAITTVQSMRPELLHVYGSVDTSFRTSLGPLYFEQVDLFLRHAAALEAHPQAAILPQYEYYLQRARDTVEQFKTAELRDYFRDTCVDAARASITALERVSPQALIVYPILLPDCTELLISLPTGLKRLSLPVTGAQLEQLTLSACETAQGDDRAALGLAGVAIKAGARSALATLWLVAAAAAALLMTEFYRALQSPGMSRARALQQAQHTLLRHPQYAEPYFWAPFLLINNWL